jgi:hypothetical protein
MADEAYKMEEYLQMELEKEQQKKNEVISILR